MFNFFETFRQKIERLLNINAETRLNDEQFILREINKFETSQRRWEMLDGERYYNGNHDILRRKRTVIGKDGKLEAVDNLPNNRIVDNQYRKAVIQKNNYLLGQPLTIRGENEKYTKLLNGYINKKFMRTLKSVGEDALNCGVAWLFPMYDDRGSLTFKRFNPWEIIPGWKDDEHTELKYFIRVYEVTEYVSGSDERIIEKVEVYDEGGVSYFRRTNGGRLKPDGGEHVPYFHVGEQGYVWNRIPLIPFKYNNKETPLIKMVKSLQDGLNVIESNFLNQMEEDSRNTILVVVNYSGTNLAEFRKNLATYGAVKVNTVDGVSGDVKSLQVEVNAENYKAIIDIFRKAIIENAMGYDAKDDRMSNSPNRMNIQSMYSDTDLDANSMETEFQAALEDVLWFINMDLANRGQGDYENENIEIIFNRDMMINEAEVIDSIAKSVGILSEETLIAQHPWVDDPQLELNRLESDRQRQQMEIETQYVPFMKDEN